MGQIYDISSKLSREKKVIKISDELEFEVNDSKNAVLKVMELSKNDSENMDAIIEVLLGKEALKKIDKAGLSFQDYITISKALMATIMGTTLEEFDERFHE